MSVCQRRSASFCSVSGGDVRFALLSCKVYGLFWVSPVKQCLMMLILWLSFLTIYWMWLDGFRLFEINTPKSFCVEACCRLHLWSVSAYFRFSLIFRTPHMVSLNPRRPFLDHAASWFRSCWRQWQSSLDLILAYSLVSSANILAVFWHIIDIKQE